MRKEILWAAVIGISFGLLIAFGAWRINSSFKPRISSGNILPTPIPTSEFKIALDKPENQDVVVEDSIEVSGLTKPNATITISVESEDYLTKSGSDGVFMQEVGLVPGVNQIKITAFDPNGSQSMEKVLVVYSSAFQTRKIESTPDSNATSDASIRQKVQEKVEAALNRPKAFIGVVTDIADSTIQIKASKGEIKQISISGDDTSVIKSGTTNKAVKVKDIAIGDFIVAMGYVNSSSVLAAQRILITEPLVEPKLNVKLANVSKFAGNKIVAKSDGDESDMTIIPDKKTTFYYFDGSKITKTKFSAVVEGNFIVYVEKETENAGPTIRTVFILH